MSKSSRSILKQPRPAYTAFFLVVLMLGSTLTAANDSDFASSLLPEAEFDTTGEMFFHPAPNQSSISTNFSSIVEVPSNHTFLEGTVEVEPLWNRSTTNGTHFGVGEINQWNGTHALTNGIGHGGKLTLATNSSLGSLTDFESTIVAAPRWLGTGNDHEAWSIQRPSIVPLSSSSGMVLPTNGSSSIGFLATQAQGDLEADMDGCLRSPTITTPFLLNNYTLQFDSWTALLSDDAAWIEIRDANGSWNLLRPQDGYPSSSVLNNTPSSVWNGESGAWNSTLFDLNGYVDEFQPTVQFQLCFQTSSSTGARGGWFIDNFEVRNDGDEPGAWFHGNLTGDYAPNAVGDFVLPVDFSNLTGQNVELEVWSNWDIQGAAFDTMNIEISYNNGTTYSALSPFPGYPSAGAVCGGQWFNGGDSSNRWCPFHISLPWNLTSPVNASSLYLRFTVQTNSQTNYGGTTSSGWEGIALDDLGVWINRGTASETYTRLHNFTSQPSGLTGSSNGWLESRGVPNEWQWTTTFEHNSRTVTVFDFDSGDEVPAGWSLWSQTNRRWDIGPTSNASGFGPGVWHSGLNGAGIYLDDEYRSDMWTELYTPEYFIPENSTSRLTFRSWVCTEANWDGGAVSISTDGGDNWWFIPPTLGTFHDQLSTVNGQSPLYNEGIIDGSRVVGGCHNVQRGFDLKQYDLSNLTGSSVRAKFTFFSDQLVELDGWYIDDAGIEIDVYEPVGTWTSELLTPDPQFGWGQVDGLVVEPSNTSVRFDILDANGTVIPGYQNRTLPIDLPFDTVLHDELYVRAHLSSLERLITPSIQRLSVGPVTFFDAYHLTYLNDFSGVNLDQLEIGNDFMLRTASNANYVSLLWTSPSFCPFQSAQFQLINGNLTATHGDYSVVASTWGDTLYPVLTQTIERQGRPKATTDFSLTWAPGQSNKAFVFEPLCSVAPSQPEITLGTSATSLFAWPESSESTTLGYNQHFYGVQLSNAPLLQGLDNLTFTHSGETSTAHLSVLVARNRASSALSAFDVSYLIDVTSDGSSASLRHGTFERIDFQTNTLRQYHRVHFSSVCTSQTQLTEHLDICTMEMHLQGNFSAVVSNLMFIPHQQSLTTHLTHHTLNSLLDEAYVLNPSSSVHLPMTVHTFSGSVMVNLSYMMQTKLVDRVLSPSHDRWLPQQTVQFETHHWRGDAHSMEVDAPDITSITLGLSSQPTSNGLLIEVEAYNLESTPQFRQLSGAGLAMLNADQSSVECTLNTCAVNWSLTSRWLLDDVDDVYLFAKATDVDGFSTGPHVKVRQTFFNEIENDLEVIGFRVLDENQRDLNDWSNPQWPFHLNASQGMVATGMVRFEGIVDAFVQSGDAEVRIDATAVPPQNISGGPNEWSGQPIDWSASWFGDVDASGSFSIDLQSPDLDEPLPSNTRILLTPHIHRSGPLGENTSSSTDRTSSSIGVPFLFDKVHPNTLRLDALDSGRFVPADGHIWTAQQDVALRLAIEDPEGLSNELQLYSWLESSHDVNANGIMEEIEYSVRTVSFSSGQTSAQIDLPLLPWQDILQPGRSSAKASIVIQGFDLAGNQLEGGGDFGEENDLATFELQERYDTSIDTETVSFDLFQSQLLPGYEHTFSFVVTDGNGLQSLDSLQFALLGRDYPETCAITFEPRFEDISYDQNCFQTEPLVTVTQRPLFSEWQVDIQFRLAWNLIDGVWSGTPSLKVFDEGQSLGLGLSRMEVFDWTLSTELELSPLRIVDQTAPFGTLQGSTLWIHKNDTIAINATMFHANTSIPAEVLPNNVSIQTVASDGERAVQISTPFTPSGSVESILHLDETVLNLQRAALEVEVVGLPTFQSSSVFNITFDGDAPLLSIPPGVLSQVDSNAMDAVEVTLMVSDEFGVNRSSVDMNWHFTRAGQIIAQTSGSSNIPFLSQTSTTSTFSSQVHIELPDTSLLEKNDRLIVWFTGKDLSGRLFSGFATAEAPVTPNFRWIAFEPQFENIVATPYSAKVGEEVSIFVRVSNIGILAGNMTVECYDDTGTLLSSNTSYLEGGTWVDHVWQVEAWKTGRLGLTVRIVNHTGNVPVSMANVEEYDQRKGDTTTALGFAGLVFLLCGGILIAAILRRREQINQFTVDQVYFALDRSSLPPPRPKDLVELTQEE